MSPSAENPLEKIKKPEHASRIGAIDRIVPDVGIPVEGLRVADASCERVGGEEALCPQAVVAGKRIIVCRLAVVFVPGELIYGGATVEVVFFLSVGEIVGLEAFGAVIVRHGSRTTQMVHEEIILASRVWMRPGHAATGKKHILEVVRIGGAASAIGLGNGLAGYVAPIEKVYGRTGAAVRFHHTHTIGIVGVAVGAAGDRGAAGADYPVLGVVGIGVIGSLSRDVTARAAGIVGQFGEFVGAVLCITRLSGGALGRSRIRQIGPRIGSQRWRRGDQRRLLTTSLSVKSIMM